MTWFTRWLLILFGDPDGPDCFGDPDEPSMISGEPDGLPPRGW